MERHFIAGTRFEDYLRANFFSRRRLIIEKGFVFINGRLNDIEAIEIKFKELKFCNKNGLQPRGESLKVIRKNVGPNCNLTWRDY